MADPKVQMMMGEDSDGRNVIMVPNDAEPLGMMFKEPAATVAAGTSTGTTATVSFTAGPDTDTDPPDSDSD